MSTADQDLWQRLSMDRRDRDADLISKRSRYCKNCRIPMDYISLGEYLCPDCGSKEYDEYGKVRAYIDEHGPSTAYEINQATGVPKNIVNDFLRGGKLEIASGPKGYLRCEMCGTEIRYGRICTACAKTDGAKAKGYYIGDVGEAPQKPIDHSGEMHLKKRRDERIRESFKPMGE